MKFTFGPEARPLDGYTIKRAIARGGFGEVYYALTDSGKEVAIKLLQENLEVELRGVTQCLNLKHPNLFTLFDFQILLQQFDRDLFTRIGQRVIHLAEATPRDGSLDRVPVERSCFRTERELHDVAAFEDKSCCGNSPPGPKS